LQFGKFVNILSTFKIGQVMLVLGTQEYLILSRVRGSLRINNIQPNKQYPKNGPHVIDFQIFIND